MARAVIKSSLCVLALLFAFVLPSAAHEVRPSVGDVSVNQDTIRLDIQVTLEALVAGIDLTGIEDTNDSPLSGYYDQLRGLAPDELRTAFDKVWPRIASGFVLTVDGMALTPEIVDLRIPEVGDTDLPRDSVLTVSAGLPEGAAPVQVGWSASYGPLVLRQVGQGDELYTGYLTDGQLSDPLPRQGVAQVGGWAEFGRYIILGFEHIIPLGLDHILFVLGLFFFSLHMKPLLWQVSAFTLAHTVTLALASMGVVQIPAEIVEPLIAASIVYVAIENIRGGTIGWRRTGVVFGFGLLHGLGFASVLGEIGLNPSRFIYDLIGFNIGVELGQLAVITIAYLSVGVWFGSKAWYRRSIAVPASVVIALVGAYWFVERTIL